MYTPDAKSPPGLKISFYCVDMANYNYFCISFSGTCKITQVLVDKKYLRLLLSKKMYKT